MGTTKAGTRGISIHLRRTGVIMSMALTLIGSALTTLSTTPALAVSAPVALDAPENGSSPLMAYDALTQTTYVAWTDPVRPGVDLCIMPSGATGCEGMMHRSTPG